MFQYYIERITMTITVTIVAIKTRHMIPRTPAMTLPGCNGKSVSAIKSWIFSWGGLVTVWKETCSGNCGLSNASATLSLCLMLEVHSQYTGRNTNRLGPQEHKPGPPTDGLKPWVHSWCLWPWWLRCPAEARILCHGVKQAITQESEQLKEKCRGRQSNCRSSFCFMSVRWVNRSTMCMSVCVCSR